MQNTVLSPSDFVALVNQTLEFAYPEVVLEGEVSGFSLSQGKFVFFDVKDTQASVGCFMMAYQLKLPISDGMQVRLTATVKLTNKGRFSLSVRQIIPVGEGALARAFSLLKAKLEAEGLFALERKRVLPLVPQTIGLISSNTAAGARDFLTILSKRWPLANVAFAHVAVQGESAPDQIVGAIQYFNLQPQPVDVLVLVRGGGSLDNLMAFNTEPVVRSIASSRIPTLVGVGHEEDITLADLAADVRAATPTQAASLVAPDYADMLRLIKQAKATLKRRIQLLLVSAVEHFRGRLVGGLEHAFEHTALRVAGLSRALSAYDPRAVLKRGYGLIRSGKVVITSVNQLAVGATMTAELSDGDIKSKVTHVKERE